MEIIRMILESNEIRIERELDQHNTDYFRRQTLQIDTAESGYSLRSYFIIAHSSWI